MARRGGFPFHAPLVWPLFLFVFILGAVLFALVALHVLTVGFGKLGLSGTQVFTILAASFLGSVVNIPIKKLESEAPRSIEVRTFFGMRYRLPASGRRHTLLAVNVGGCVVPVGVSVYLLSQMPAAIPTALVCVGACAVITYSVSRVLPGAGVATPWFVPPAASALLAVLLGPSGLEAPLAYVTGSLGTLVGADLFNLPKIKKLNAPVVSIGGAGTWDGIFLSGLLASVLAF